MWVLLDLHSRSVLLLEVLEMGTAAVAAQIFEAVLLLNHFRHLVPIFGVALLQDFVLTLIQIFGVVLLQDFD